MNIQLKGRKTEVNVHLIKNAVQGYVQKYQQQKGKEDAPQVPMMKFYLIFSIQYVQVLRIEGEPVLYFSLFNMDTSIKQL